MTDAADLQPHQTLALAYAPGSHRQTIAAAMQLENRLGAIVRGSSEPMIAQLKLAWWRDRFAQPVSQWPAGEPLLARLSRWPRTERLGRTVDGYEALLGQTLDAEAVKSFAAGRSCVWRVVAEHCGFDKSADAAADAGSLVGLSDLASRITVDSERAVVVSFARKLLPAPKLPKGLRSLAILSALSQRAIENGGIDLADGPGAYLTAVRVGMFGR